MKNFTKKIVSAVLTATLAIGSLFTFSACSKNYTKDNETIKIGVSGPLTGGAAMYGVAVRNSAQLAVDEINANGGLDGMKFELLALDDKHDKRNVTTTFSSMFENGMQISLGCVTTAPGLEFKELANDENVFVLTPSATGDAIVADYDNAFQMCFSNANQGTASAKFFNDNYKGKTIGIFYKSDDEYSKGIYEKFMASLDESFKEGLADRTVLFTGDNYDFNSVISKFANCDVIFLPIYTQPAAAFMKIGVGTVKNDAIYYGCDGLDGVENEFGADEFAKIPQEVSFLSHFNSKATSGPAADFIKKYNDKYDEEKEPLNQFGASAYDCVYAIYEALKTAKANGKEFDTTTSASDFCDIITEVFTSDSFVFHGITGKTEGNNKSNISWEASGYVNKEAVKYVVKEANP